MHRFVHYIWSYIMGNTLSYKREHLYLQLLTGFYKANFFAYLSKLILIFICETALFYPVL